MTLKIKITSLQTSP